MRHGVICNHVVGVYCNPPEPMNVEMIPVSCFIRCLTPCVVSYCVPMWSPVSFHLQFDPCPIPNVVSPVRPPVSSHLVQSRFLASRYLYISSCSYRFFHSSSSSILRAFTKSIRISSSLFITLTTLNTYPADPHDPQQLPSRPSRPSLLTLPTLTTLMTLINYPTYSRPS